MSLNVAQPGCMTEAVRHLMGMVAEDDPWKVLHESTHWLDSHAQGQLLECLNWIEEEEDETSFIEESWRIHSLPVDESPCYSPQIVWCDGCAHVWDQTNSVYLPMAEEYRHLYPLPKQYTECHLDDIEGELQEVVRQEHLSLDMSLITELESNWSESAAPQNDEAYTYVSNDIIKEIITGKNGVVVTQNQANFVKWVKDENYRIMPSDRILIEKIPTDNMISGGGGYFVEGAEDLMSWGRFGRSNTAQPKKPYSEWIAEITTLSFAEMVNNGMRGPDSHTNPTDTREVESQDITVENAVVTMIKTGENGVSLCVVDTQDGETAFVPVRLLHRGGPRIGDTLHVMCKRVTGHKNEWRAYKVISNTDIEILITLPECNGKWGWLIGRGGETLKSVARYASEGTPPRIYLKPNSSSATLAIVSSQKDAVDIEKVVSAIRDHAIHYFGTDVSIDIKCQ